MSQNLDYATIRNVSGQTLYFPQRLVNIIINLVQRGRAIALIGEPGSGKTDLAVSVMHILKQKGYFQDYYQMEYGGIVGGDQLDGERSLTNGETRLIPSQWLLAVRAAAEGKRVGVIHDEHNRASPSGVNKQLSAFAQFRYTGDIDGVLTWEPDKLQHISTLNVGFEFSGTSAVDQALADRMFPILIPPAPREIVEKILEERYAYTDSDGSVKSYLTNMQLRNIANLYERSQKSSTEEESYRLGIRDVLRLADGVAFGDLSLKDAVEVFVGGMAILKQLPEESMQAIYTAVAAIEK